MTPTRKDGLLNFDGSVANANQQEHLAPTNPHGDESTVMGEYKTLRYANGPKKSTSCIHTHTHIYIYNIPRYTKRTENLQNCRASEKKRCFKTKTRFSKKKILPDISWFFALAPSYKLESI